MSKVKAGPPVKKYKVDVRLEELESKLSTMKNKIHCFESLDATKEQLVVENNQLAASLKALEDEMRCKKKEMDALQKVVSTVKANLQCLICQALLIEGVILPCCNKGWNEGSENAFEPSCKKHSNTTKLLKGCG